MSGTTIIASTNKILIVEDQNIVALDIQNRLKSLNYEICGIASSGAGAIKKAQDTSPDLVLMDVMLKGDMDGIEAAKEIRYRFNIPVVYLTAYTDENTLIRAKVTEPFGYILKPFEEKELHTTIEMALYRHKMEKKLREREEWFSTTLKCIGDAVIAVDKGGFVSFMNPAAENLTGWKTEEALGKKYSQVLMILENNSMHHSTDNHIVSKALNDGVTSSSTENVILIDKNKTEKVITRSASPIRNDNNQITGAVITLHDVTEKIKLEGELQKIHRLESIGILAGGIAHDFNNILTAIVGNISLAKLKSEKGNQTFELLNEAENIAFRAKELTKQLLTFSKGGQPVKQTTNLKEFLTQKLLNPFNDSNVFIEFNLPENSIHVDIDREQVKQVIQNIITNSLQAMPEGVNIIIKAEKVKENNNFLPLKNSDYIKISIKDNGPGICEMNQSKIFDPYFTTKEKASGLGLTIAFSVISKHNGLITVDSKPGYGTAINIFLPAVVNKKNINLTNRKRENNRKILVMDDEEMILDLVQKILTNSGYFTDLSRDGKEAVKMYTEALEKNEPYSLVIMDLTVPGGMGGVETIREIQAIDPEVRAIVCSGYSNDPVISNFESYGFCDVLTKPFRINELNKKIEELLS